MYSYIYMYALFIILPGGCRPPDPPLGRADKRPPPPRTPLTPHLKYENDKDQSDCSVLYRDDPVRSGPVQPKKQSGSQYRFRSDQRKDAVLKVRSGSCSKTGPVRSSSTLFLSNLLGVHFFDIVFCPTC